MTDMVKKYVPYAVIILLVYMLLPLVFIALIWWFFRKAETVQMPLFAAFMLWALYVVVSTFYKN